MLGLCVIPALTKRGWLTFEIHSMLAQIFQMLEQLKFVRVFCTSVWQETQGKYIFHLQEFEHALVLQLW